MANINFALPPGKNEDDAYDGDDYEDMESRRDGLHPDEGGRRKNIVIKVLIAVAAVAVIGVIAFLLVQHFSGDATAETASVTTPVETEQSASAEVQSSGVSIPVTKRPTAVTTEVSSSSATQSKSSAASSSKSSDKSESSDAKSKTPSVDDLRAKLDITEDYRDSFAHGDKPKSAQKYIVLHDTESSGTAQNVVDYWDSSGNLVAAHFVVNRDGSIVQCASLDTIVHHAGFGDAGHNEQYGVEDESRDDKEGTVPIGDWAPDYGMNSYSIGIEMCHVGGEEEYSDAQLNALDNLIAYIDAYYGGNAGEIIDHKAWRSGNSDTSAEFADYLENYKTTRKHSN